MMKTCAAVALAMISTLGLAAELKITLPTKQVVTTETPSRWAAHVGQVRAELPQAIVAESPENRGFKVVITPFWPEAAKGAEAKNIRTMVDTAAQAAKAEAVNKSVAVERFAAPGKKGYYFLATAASPGGDGYKYLAEGAVQYGTILVTFTVFANEEHKAVIDETLHVLRTMRASR